MVTPIVHILPLTTLRRERLLPVNGRVTARLDQKVLALDVVAEAAYGRQHLLLDVAQTFGISAAQAQKLILVKPGDTVQANEPLAEQSGLTTRAVRAPKSGRVVLVEGAKIVLEVGETSYELQASMPGIISRIIPERGVEITFHGALIQGVWGNGRLDTGMLLPLLESPNDSLSAGQMDVSSHGSILLSGYCEDGRALQIGAELPLRGLILGNLSPNLLPQAMQMSYPIVVLDGFRKAPLNSTAYRLLTTNAKREVTLNAQPYNRHENIRPEIYIPLPVVETPPMPREVLQVAVGQTVRLTRAPYAGQIATVVVLKEGLSLMPSGIRVPAAQVRLESGQEIVVPLANMEIIG
ncbi:MAG: hypothetical protein RMJ60_00820 [Anaerolineales bacterium]|nr:hypothetical protein [Anaerolineales bacterium]